MTRIVMKVVTKAEKDCHSLTKPSNNGTPEYTPGDRNDGSRRFRTSNVIAKANTPSLKASVLAVSLAPRLSPFSMGWIRRHASGRFEGAAGRSRGVRSSYRGKSRNTAIVFRAPINRGPRVAGPPRGFRTRVVVSRSLTPSTHAIELEKPQAFSFRPTQFTFLQLKTEEGMDARPMSLATSPTRPHLEYAVRLSDSRYKRAFAALRPGDEVAVFGPNGDFVLHETRPAVPLAGGIGITPLKGIAEYASDKTLPIPIRLVYSNRNEDEIVYRPDLDSLEKQNAQFRVLHTLTRNADPKWPGPTGRIDRRLVQEAARDLADPIYYVSGTPSMVVETLRLLRGLEVADASIEVEAFRGYG